MAIFGINTPEFGISEFIGDRLGQKRTSSGGSNLFGPAVQPKTTYNPPTPTQVKSGQVSGGAGPQMGQTLGSYSSNSYSPGYSSGMGVGSAPPSISAGVQGGDTSYINQLVDQALGELSGGEGAAQSAYDAAVSQAGTNYQSNLGKAQANTAATNAQLNQQEEGAKSTTKNAVADARRGYSEIAQGLQSRYGGSTGTGAFAESIVGGQTQRNVAGLQQTLANNIQKINDTRNQVKMVADQLYQDLDNQKQTSIANAKAAFDEAVQNIRAQRATLQTRKAELVTNAIQSYQAAVNRANELDSQFKQQIYYDQMQAEQKLQSAAATQAQQQKNLQVIDYQGIPAGVFNNSGQPNGNVPAYGYGQLETPGYIFDSINKINPKTKAEDDENLF